MVGAAATMNLAAIDLNVLVALDAILSEGSVTRAAVRIGRSQPATSHALNRARELFGDPLVVRMHGALQLTPRARGLAPRIGHALAALASTMETQGSFRPADVESVTIGATDYVGFVLLPHVVEALQREAPNMQRAGANHRGARRAGAGRGRPGRRRPRHLPACPRWPAGRGAVRRAVRLPAAQGASDARGCAPASIDQYARLGHVLVTSPWEGRGPVDEALERLGRQRKIAAYVPHFLVAPNIVAETDLVLTTGRRIAEQLAAPLGLACCPRPSSSRRSSSAWCGTRAARTRAWGNGSARWYAPPRRRYRRRRASSSPPRRQSRRR